MNNWLSSYKGRIEKLNFVLEESIQRGSPDPNMNINEILSLIRGSIHEIKSLQSQVDVLKIQNKKLIEEKANS